MSDICDFGFTAVDESELDAVREAQSVISATTDTSSELEDRLNKLYNAVLSLLTNLKMNPEKDYIYWPNRVDKVEQFETHIANIIKE